MQSCPALHWLCWVHDGFASAALAQKPAGEQTLMRVSMCAHCELLVQGYSQ